MPETVLILNDEVFEGDESEWEHAARDAYWAQVVCWRWIEKYFGIEVRVGGPYVVTEDWAERTRKSREAALEALIEAQDRHLESRGTHADALDDLPEFGALSDHGLPEYVHLDLIRTEDGWGARVAATRAWISGFRGLAPAIPCYAFVGTPPDELEGFAGEDRATLTERQPTCTGPLAEEEAGSEGG